jgi:hypothetical protein
MRPAARRILPLWLSRPLYEALPVFYVVAGLLLATVARVVAAERWAAAALGLGIVLVVLGVLLGWHRRRYRRSR